MENLRLQCAIIKITNLSSGEKMEDKGTPKKQLNKKKEIGLIFGAVVVGLVIAWVIFAAVVSNVDECLPVNNYCRGVFPFNQEQSGYAPLSGCHRLEDGSQICF